MDPVQPTPDQDVDLLRRRRAELRDSMAALEHALAAPAPGRAAAWTEPVHLALVQLSADLRVHIDITEGGDGLHRAVLATTPRLSNAVTRLSRDHVLLQSLIEDLLTRVTGPASEESVDAVRHDATTLLGQLVRHRQRGADLIFEAYEADIGGEA
jgi:hypothetical protein